MMYQQAANQDDLAAQFHLAEVYAESFGGKAYLTKALAICQPLEREQGGMTEEIERLKTKLKEAE
ncbi:hypothetical protein SAMN05660772_01720 [Pasteurella testudinis DSM 23072]|uniref:Uncharacterized protein n=1 Tax=Pasteurella testudinis DSM 23072 TaxID=1122938 RepID=A0A1W1UIK2_9PAST|nr:hypothetical protein [Pasteurella testudinis]SMB80859.1 hypothetical protein SAMN05660772_01720 [Pasteurella testudinis DSM 23072]SUB52289.1 Uncharacterised protein [Pasteurella testudinis]